MLTDFDEKVGGARKRAYDLKFGSNEGNFLEFHFSWGDYAECHSNEFQRQVFVSTFSSVSAQASH